VYEPRDGSKFAELGVEILFKTTAEQSAGGLSFFEYKAPALFAGPPAHYHKKLHEGFYCLEGTLGLEMDGRAVELRAGAYAFVPPYVMHSFWNPTSAPVRFLCVMNPGGMERYFRELAEMVRAEAAWPPADMRRVIELGEKHDTFFAPVT